MRDGSPESLAIFGAGAAACLSVTILQPAVSGHIVWPWQFAAALRAETGHLEALRANVLDRNLFYGFVWLLPLGLLRLTRFPMPWIVASGGTAASRFSVRVLRRPARHGRKVRIQHRRSAPEPLGRHVPERDGRGIVLTCAISRRIPNSRGQGRNRQCTRVLNYAPVGRSGSITLQSIRLQKIPGNFLGCYTGTDFVDAEPGSCSGPLFNPCARALPPRPPSRTSSVHAHVWTLRHR